MDHLNTAIHEHLLSLGWTVEALVRLVLAALLGGVIGIERETRGREAGFRTNILVCLGSALVMLVSAKMAELPWQPAAKYAITIDPGRIAYGVMAGIGFLGAGAIMKHGANVRGLTTAAGLWCIAAVGLAAGMGQYLLSTGAALLVLGALWMLQVFDGIIPRRRFRRLTIRMPWKEGTVDSLLASLKDGPVEINDSYFRRIADLSAVEVELWISFVELRKFADVQKRLSQMQGIELIGSEPL